MSETKRFGLELPEMGVSMRMDVRFAPGADADEAVRAIEAAIRHELAGRDVPRSTTTLRCDVCRYPRARRLGADVVRCDACAGLPWPSTTTPSAGRIANSDGGVMFWKRPAPAPPPAPKPAPCTHDLLHVYEPRPENRHMYPAFPGFECVCGAYFSGERPGHCIGHDMRTDCDKPKAAGCSMCVLFRAWREVHCVHRWTERHRVDAGLACEHCGIVDEHVRARNVEVVRAVFADPPREWRDGFGRLTADAKRCALGVLEVCNRRGSERSPQRLTRDTLVMLVGL